jgi:hypothetical protein
MDPSSILALSSVAGTVGKSVSGMFSTWIYTKYKKWRLKKRLTGVLLLKGVSTISQKLSNNEVLFFDIDVLYRELTAPKEAVENHKEPTVVENFTAYPILRNHVFNLTNIYKGQIIIVSHSLELLRAVGIYEENIKFYAFSKAMEQNIGVIFPSEVDRAYAELTKFRTIREMNVEQIVLVDNLQDLEKKLKEQYHQNKINV